MHTSYSAAKDAALELSVLKEADEIVVVSEPIRQLYLKKSASLDSRKFHVIPNGFDTSDFAASVKPSTVFSITYVGTMSDIYRPATFIYALKKFISANPGINLELKFVGAVNKEIRKLIADNLPVQFIRYQSYVEHSVAIQLMQQSVLLLLVIPDVADSKGILTGKLFEYLGSRRAVIGLGPADGEAAKILEKCGQGKMFERSEEDELLKHLQKMYDIWIKGGEIFSGNENYLAFSRSELTSRLVSII
jgi:glycosyltransferase involved in cell wall biosynthesis